MKVSREDLGHIDTIIGALHKIRFDLNAVECMRLATSLGWFGQLRTRMDEECRVDEAAHAQKVDAALKSAEKPMVLEVVPSGG